MHILKTLAILLTFISFLPSTAYACKCAGMNPQWAYQHADLVLIGPQISEGLTPDALRLDIINGPISFAVQQVIKGVYTDKNISVHRHSHPTNGITKCEGFLVKQPDPFLIFLAKDDQGFKLMDDCYAASFVVKDGAVSFHTEKVPLDHLQDYLQTVLPGSNNPVKVQ